MNTVELRKKLHDYIADAADNKIQGMYLLLEEEIDRKVDFELTSRHREILEDERNNHQKGLSASYSWEEAKKIIREKP